ncbi:nose resistant to fluoxetine protein 6-like [Centruroides sculpturatus]|uniref:nose resistant to fluoxetine protein 6-like n=1 Tax=Centruroides sculpturatus TaxID=218467 RepID=UPI000C6E03F1|nr:nose resistant to fluoxetine protein 6-like [Centruroides sculpturatus]
MEIRLDVCIPSTCSNKDLQHVGNWIFGTAVDFNVGYCKIKDERIKYRNGQLISLIVLGMFIAWVGLATLTEILMRLHIIPLKASEGRFFEYILGASPYKSLHKLYSTNLDESTKSICGVKFFLINIVVLGHVGIAGIFFTTIGEKYTNIFKQAKLLLFEIIFQGLTMIESFFFYSGFMVMYLRQKSGRNSAKYYIMILVKRVIRYTLPIFFVLGFLILLPLLGEGPHWDVVISQAKLLESKWWKYISHIHIYSIGELTEGFNVLWFISALLQLSILMSLLLCIVDRWPRFGRLAIIVLMLTGIMMYIVDVVSNRYYVMLGIPAASEKSYKYMLYNYFKPYYSHLGTYCFGALIGDILRNKKKIPFGKITLLLCWTGCIVLMTLSIFGAHSYKKNIMANENIIIAFQCISPFAWTVGLAWLTVACVTGHGGTVNRLLSLRIFVVLNSLNVWIYLLHGLIICYGAGSMRKATGLLQFNMWMIYSFVMFLSLIAALFYFVFFESPLRSLLSLVLRNRPSQETVTSNENITEMKTDTNSKSFVV